jgi:hypothetical protein
MKSYLIISGAIFGLITLAHLARIIFENHRLALDPIFVLLTLAAAALTVWAWRIWRRLSSAGKTQ